MSSQRVILDSDDEDGDSLSEIASSCDPLQDSSYTFKRTDADIARVNDSNTDLQLPMSTFDLPQVDFDKFLRSESSIMAGDYEDEKWVSSAHSSLAHAVNIENDNNGETRNDGFSYTFNAHHNASNSLPPTSDGSDMHVTESDHPSKRRKLSLTQDTLQSGGTRTDSSYNFFASSDPNGLSQTTSLLPPLTTEETNGATLPLPTETPPPTIPFSEDAPYYQEASLPDTKIENEIQEAIPQQPFSETETEVLSTKKKRGRPKKQETIDTVEAESKTVSNDVVEVTELSVKRKPGRPKKQLDDTAVDQVLDLDTSKDGTLEATNESILPAGTSKSSKKKLKRSKTTSDIPNKSSELITENDVLWAETTSKNSIQDIAHGSVVPENKAMLSVADDKAIDKYLMDEQSTVEEPKVPKKRGRKRKSTAEGPAASTENQTVLQDISNIAPPSQERKQNSIDKEQDNDSLKIEDEPGTACATDATEKPGNHDITADVLSNEVNTENSTTTPKMQLSKTTTISSAGRVPLRVGLSRRARIAPLLKVVRK